MYPIEFFPELVCDPWRTLLLPSRVRRFEKKIRATRADRRDNTHLYASMNSI
jgi:hypothetical protein